MTDGSPLSFALAYANIGWHVFPVARGTKAPIGSLTPRGHLEATTDLGTITRWWTSAPDAGIGVAMQASRLVAIDVDPRNGGHFDLERIEAEHGKLETDVIALTGGGGMHLCFWAPSDIGRLPGKLAKGIDLKADGYIVVEPSIHPSGKAYVWEASSNPLEGCVPSPLPGWIADMARAAPSGSAQGATPPPIPPRGLSEIELAELRAAMALIPADERETWVKVGMALHRDVGGALGYQMWTDWSKTCPAKFDPQDQTRVWMSFRWRPMGEAIQLASVFELAYRHGFKQATQPPIDEVPTPEGEPDPRTANTTQEVVAGPRVDIRPMPVQGLNELAQWIYETTTNAHMLLAQAAALAVAGACAGRRYVSEYKDPASLYIGMLAPTASQARPMLTAAEQALTDTNLRHIVRSQRFNSTQQLYTAFMRSSSLFYAADDWGDQLAHAKRQPSGLLSICHGVIAGRVHLAHDIVLDNWVEVGLTKRPEDAPVAHTPTLYKPALTMLASIAEAQMRVAFKRNEFGRGALDCMLFVPALNVDDWADRPVAVGIELPATVRARMLEIRGIPVDIAEMPEPKVDSILIRPTPLIVRFACDLASAERRWIERGRKLPPPLRPLAWGYRTTMRRACVAMAAFADPAQPLVTQDMLDWADRLVSQCLDITLSEVALLGGDDDDKPDAGSKLLESLVRAGPEGMAQRDLPKYCWAYKRLGVEDRKEILGRLLADDEITDLNTPRGKRYVARQFVVDNPVNGSGESK